MRSAPILFRRSNTKIFVLILACAMLVSGCRVWNPERLARRAASISTIGQNTVSAKPLPRATKLGLVGKLVTNKPLPSERTQQLLRRFVLDKTYATDPLTVLKVLKDQCRGNPALTEVHALAELAKIEGDWIARTGKQEDANRMYATAVLHSYQFLFDDQLDFFRNAYDPQFRSISDIYNRSLECLLQGLKDQKELVVGNRISIPGIDETLNLKISVQGRWSDQEFERFELVNDYEVEGLENEYRTYGLGVPMIAVRKQQEQLTTNEKYYPPGLSLPLTAFLQVVEPEVQLAGGSSSKTIHAELKLIDPLQQTLVTVNGRRAPLESDISTPMAYYLNDPILNSNMFATLAMLDADFAKNFQGLYMLEPYDPDKIPVVMIHGFWSSPTTWLQMFNDLRASRDVREHYQFWFYMYPTGQPFWVSAAQAREDLATVKRELDPNGRSEALNQTVLVAHSMGGLVARMQTIDSGNDFWNIVSDEPFSKVQGDPESLGKLKRVFDFEANDSVKRVITIATPHEGSSFANNTTRWLSHKAFSIPQLTRSEHQTLMKENQEIFGNSDFARIKTSVDSMTPGAPFIKVLNEKPLPENVKFHNIYGQVSTTNLFGGANRRADRGDGVVSRESATAIECESQLEVEAEHVQVHQTPQAILEVRRILLDHLVDTERIRPEDKRILPAGHYEAAKDDED